MNYPLIRNIPIPVEYQPFVAILENEHRKRKRTWQDRINDDTVLLDFLFPGRAVVCIKTPDGLAYVADAEVGKGIVREIQDNLPDDVRKKSQIYHPDYF